MLPPNIWLKKKNTQKNKTPQTPAALWQHWSCHTSILVTWIQVLRIWAVGRATATESRPGGFAQPPQDLHSSGYQSSNLTVQLYRCQRSPNARPKSLKRADLVFPHWGSFIFRCFVKVWLHQVLLKSRDGRTPSTVSSLICAQTQMLVFILYRVSLKESVFQIHPLGQQLRLAQLIWE